MAKIKMSEIYHYTSIAALQSMLKNYRKSTDKEHLQFWASSIFSLNDPMEMFGSQEIIKGIMTEIENSLHVGEDVRLSNTIDVDYIKKLFHEGLKNYKYKFIISFSHNKDTLPMWSMYANKGKGVCLCFDKEIIEDYFKHNENVCAELVSVAYGNEISSYLRNRLVEKYKQYMIWLTDDDIPDKKNTYKLSQFSLLSELAPLYKDPAYKYEEEERLICDLQGHDDSIDFRLSSSGYIIPFRKINIPISALKEIIIGPTYNFDMLNYGLKYEIILSGCKVPKISYSKVQYRDI